MSRDMEEPREEPGSANGDPGVLCFQHCDKRAKVFAFSVPEFCPVCGSDLRCADLRTPPFRIPFPFRNAAESNVPCSVVIKPTNGDFLHNYQNAVDLHIGVTDSRGVVHEYDRAGWKNTETDRWNQCLAISIVPSLDKKWMDYWDYSLQAIGERDTWSPESYNENDHNCYTFVLMFLKTLQLRSLSATVRSKTDFCREFIVPRTTQAAKYISLYRKLLQNESKTFIKM